MKNTQKRNIAIGIIFSMLISMIPQRIMAYDIETTNNISLAEGLEVVELAEPTNENDYVVLKDVIVTSELTDQEAVKVTLTNIGAFDISEWALAYEASYDIVSLENAKLVVNSEVKEIKCTDESDVIESNECIIINLTINGEYSELENYQVYGLCDGISDVFSVTDYISYNALTGETSLTTFDINNLHTTFDDAAYSQGESFNTLDTILEQEIAFPKSIIGDDGRKIVTNVNDVPYRSIACIVVEFENAVGLATGFMISPQYMLTAAHCVYDSIYGTAKSVTAYFGATGSTYAKKVTASSWVYCSAYPSSASTGSDWACIRFSSSPNRGYFSVGYASNSTLLATTLTVCGYPDDKADDDSNAPILGKKRYMYQMSEKPSGLESGAILYTIDTFSGQSGSPVYDDSNIVYGIHSRSGNKACRITAELYNMFESSGWIN